MIQKAGLVLFALLVSYVSNAQTTLYNLNTIQKIEINFSIPDWDYRMDTAKHGSEGYLMADWVSINGVSYDSVGVKYKGNSSYDSTQIKNPLHIEFNAFKNHNHEGYKDIKLSNGYGDPSLIREVLAYNILGNYMHCPQANYAQVYVNGNYFGIYSSAENIDKKFCADHFYSNQGTFIKCNPIINPGPTTKSNFRYLGADSSLYSTYYEIKSDDGWNELVKLCDTVTNNAAALPNTVDLDRAIWMLAFNNTFINLDSYSGVFAQNHYIYRDQTHHYNPVIWDLNMCFGGFPFAGQGPTSFANLTPATMQTFAPDNHGTDDYWPLIKAIQANDTYRRMYLAHMKTMIAEVISNNSYSTLATQLRSLIDTAVQSDNNKFFTYAQYQSAMNTDIVNGSFTVPGISNLMTGRAAYLLALPEFTATAPAITAITPSNNAPAYNSTVTITANITNAISVYLGCRFDKKLKFQKLVMYDDGAHNDGAAGDNVYGVAIAMSGAQMQYYIYAENAGAGMFSPQRAEHEYHVLTVATVLPAAGDVVINEILAINSTNEYDEYHDREDWIELYNNSAQTIDLSNTYLSNRLNNLLKWKFPADTYILPNGYLTVWADDDSLEQVLHTNFNLSKDTGILLWSTAAAVVLDSTSFTNQVADVSWGRYPNGSGSFISMNTTFGSQNNNWPLSQTTVSAGSNDVQLYPNPADGFVKLTFRGRRHFTLYNIFGSRIGSFSGTEQVRFNTSALAEGLYILKSGQDVLRFLVSH